MATDTLVNGLAEGLARKLGMMSDEDGPDPETPLDWAIHWAGRGLKIFPADFFLGNPLVPKWFEKATSERDLIVKWWSEWPDADIGVVPELSQHYVITASGTDGAASLADLEDDYGPLPAEFTTPTRWGSVHHWMKGHALSSHHRLGRGIHVIGAGQYIYLPPSAAPLGRGIE